MTASPASPCIRICTLDAANAFCTGCGRTLSEIAAWSGLPDASRIAIMGELGERLRRHAAGAR